MQIRTLAAFFLLSVSPAVTFAGMAVLESGGDGSPQIHLEYSGANLIRMNFSGQAGMYMIMRDGKAYSVIEQDQEVMVIDMMASMGNMSGLMGNMSSGQNLLGEDNVYEMLSFEDTGREETVAGVNGDVYEMTFVDGNGNTSTETLVLSSDARAREMTSAFMGLSQSMSAALQQQKPEGYDQMQKAMNNKGLLRYGSNFRVASFEPGEPDASRFVLPAEPMSFNLGSMMNSIQQANGDAEVEDSGNILGDIFGNQVDRQQNRVEDKSEQKIEQEIDSSVDRAVDKVFNRFLRR